MTELRGWTVVIHERSGQREEISRCTGPEIIPEDQVIYCFDVNHWLDFEMGVYLAGVTLIIVSAAFWIYNLLYMFGRVDAENFTVHWGWPVFAISGWPLAVILIGAIEAILGAP